MALKQDRALDEKKTSHGAEFSHSVAEGFRVYRGSLVAVCADGTIVPAGSVGTKDRPITPVAIVGLARQFKDNSDGGSMLVGDMVGAHPIWVEKGCYALPFDTAPSWADLNKPVYAIDDETVSLSKDASPSSETAGASPETPGESGSSPNASAPSRLQVGTLVGFEPDGTPFVLIP